MKKISVILFNLGGPDSQEAVKPFLFNLFNDKNIITIKSNFLRGLIAKFISWSREKKSLNIYNQIGGRSPILPLTLLQALKLEEKLNEFKEAEFKVEVLMRYWHPKSSEIVEKIDNYNPEEIFLIPLYPQFSTTTTLSSLEDFLKSMKKNYKVKTICCYPIEENFIKAHTELILKEYSKYSNPANIRLIFSAHGLPEKIVEKGDPYVWQVKETVRAIIERLQNIDLAKDLIKDLDYVLAFQSRVGPLKWIGPSTEEEIKKAALGAKDIILIPISFVSEHSETLYELDIEFKNLALSLGVKNFHRVAALGVNSHYIEALEKLCLMLFKESENKFVINKDICKEHEIKILNMFNNCPKEYSQCICRGNNGRIL